VRPTYPIRQGDPKTRAELDEWLKRREEALPGIPLSAREYLMVQALTSLRRRYAKM
jgi:hypothetical protein